RGLAAAGIGSDTGGSVRLPAAWNSLVGLKTTHGLLPDDGVVFLSAAFDTIGPLTRSVEDAALLTAMMGARRAPDLSGVSVKGARLMVLETVVLDDDCRDEPRAAFEVAVDALAAAGAIIERREAPEITEVLATAGHLVVGETWAEWGEEIEARGDVMYAPIRKRFESGASVTAAQYLRGWNKLNALRAQWNARVAGYDAVLIPSVPMLPPNTQALLADEEFFMSENLLALRNTRIGNLLGVCGLTLPTETPMTGIMLMGRPFDEWRLCRLGAAAAPIVGPSFV
ncbi:MAG: amidase, partial [Pikeienuella sp.]